MHLKKKGIKAFNFFFLNFYKNLWFKLYSKYDLNFKICINGQN